LTGEIVYTTNHPEQARVFSEAQPHQNTQLSNAYIFIGKPARVRNDTLKASDLSRETTSITRTLWRRDFQAL